jgi:putative membrane protein
VPPRAKDFLQNWVINTLAVLVAVYVVPGIQFKDRSFWTPCITSLLLGILNAFIRPIMLFLAWPLLLFTLGLFRLVINAMLLYFVGFLLNRYLEIQSFWSAFLGALVISVIATLLNLLTGRSKAKVRVERKPPSRSDPPEGGEIIDV